MNKSSIKNILFVDIPTYRVVLPDLHRDLIDKRLRFQNAILEDRIGRKFYRPALSYSRGLLTLAACLEREGYKIHYLVHSDPLDRDQIYLLGKEADVICVNAMTPTFNIARELVANVKKVNPDCVSIIGGPHINAVQESALIEGVEFDYAMVGECENRLPQLIKGLDNPSDIPGVIFRSNQDVKMNRSNLGVVMVYDIPLPAYHLLKRPLSFYSHNIKTFRGCPYKCSFCAERLTWTSVQQASHTIDQVIKELMIISRDMNANTLIHFSDAVFNINWSRTKEMLDRIRSNFPNLLFSCDTRVDMINEEHVSQLCSSNVMYIRMGFESLHNSILSKADKASSHDMQLMASQIIRAANKNIGIHAYLLTGLPSSTRETIAADGIWIRNLVKSGGVDVVGNKILVPYPGTPFYEKSQEYGINILTKNWSAYDRRSYPVFRLNELSADEIYFGYLQQEAILKNAYEEILGKNAHNLLNGEASLDYIYSNYAKPKE